MIRDIQANVAIIKTQSRAYDGPTTTKTANTMTWAQIASRDALPPSIQSRISSGSTTASIDNAKHKEIVMRYKDNKPVPNSLHALKPSELTKALNDALQRSKVPQVNKARFTAARVNARGSIVAYTETAGEAEILRHNRDSWREEVAKGMEVIVPTFPVLVHGVPIKSVNLDKKEEMFELLRFENKQAMGNHKMADARWLKKYKEGQRDGSIIIDCETPEGANAIIKAGTLAWAHGLRPTKKCDPSCQFLRCLKCYKYGKCKGTYCTNNETCGKCASTEHNTGDCPATEKKCVLCGGQHYAWSQQCPEYKKEIQRVQNAKVRLELNPWYPEAARQVSPGPSKAGSETSNAQSTISSTQNSAISSTQNSETMDTDPLPPFRTMKKRKQRKPLSETDTNARPNQNHREPHQNTHCGRETEIVIYEDLRDQDDSNDEDSNLSQGRTHPKSRRTQKNTSPQ